MRSLILASLAAVVLATPASAVTLRSDEKSYPTTGIEQVHVDFPVGSLQIEATDQDRVSMTVYIKCKHSGSESCERHADDIRIDSSKRGERLDLKVEGIPKFNLGRFEVECRVKVPRALDLDVDMGVGELIIRDISGDLLVDLGVGEIDVALAENAVRAVKLNVGIGEANFSSPHGRKSVSGLFGRRINWSDGAGPSRVDVDLGVGEARVHLD